jgi:hypothetical protein
MDEFDAAPGLYPNMESAHYHLVRAISKSRLDVWSQGSPKHYWERFINPDHEPEEQSPALILGDAIHGAVLEPDTFRARYMCLPEDAPRRPSARQITAKKPSPDSVAAMRWWDDFNASRPPGAKLITAEQFDIALKCRDAVHTHPVAKILLTDGVAETSYFAIDPQTGLLVKVRPDFKRLNHGMIVDLKSTKDAHPDEFGRSAENFRYHVQGSFYTDVVNHHHGGAAIEHFVFLAVEKEPPFAVGIYYMQDEDFEDGQFEYQEDMAALAPHIQDDFWPDYGHEPIGLVRPYWAKSKRRRKETAYKSRQY